MVERKPPVRTAARTELVWAALAIVYVLWGSTYFGIRIAVETIPPLLMSGVRFLIAGTILFAWRFPAAARSGVAPSADQWRRTLVIGAALMLGGNGGVAWAEQTVPSAVAALIVSLVPLWMALIDRVMFRRTLAPGAIVGLVIGFAGTAVLVWSPGGGPVSHTGALILVLASISWAGGSIYARQAALPPDSLLTTGMEMLMGGLCLSVAGLVTGDAARIHLGAIATASWIAFVYLIFLGGIVGFSAYLWLLRSAPTALVSTYAYVNPMVAVLLGWSLGHEGISVKIAAAGLIIVLAVALIVSTVSKPPIAEAGECG